MAMTNGLCSNRIILNIICQVTGPDPRTPYFNLKTYIKSSDMDQQTIDTYNKMAKEYDDETVVFGNDSLALFWIHLLNYPEEK